MLCMPVSCQALPDCRERIARSMHSAQAGILQAVPQVGRYLLFSVADATHLASALLRLSELADGTTMVVVGEIHTANATVYLVDSVMLPPSVTG